MKKKDFEELNKQKATHEFFFRTLKKVAEPTRFDEIEKAYREMLLDTPLPLSDPYFFPGRSPEENRRFLRLIKGGRYGEPKGAIKQGARNNWRRDGKTRDGG